LIFETENLEKQLVQESAEFSKGKNAFSIKLKQFAYSDETVHPIPGQTEQLFL
jgi:hypothetical protein